MNIRNLNKNNLNFKSISNTNGKTIKYLIDNYYEIYYVGENHKIMHISNFLISLAKFTYREGTLIRSDGSILANGYISDLWGYYDYGVEKTIKNTSRILS